MKVITLLILLFSSTLAFSTGQNGDILIWNTKRYSLLSNPLEDYPQFDLLRPKLFGDKQFDWNTACYRGYIAEWEISGNQLYLTNIFSCNDRKIKANLSQIFPDLIKDGKIKAFWVNQTLIVPEGKCLYYGNIGYSYIYETEYELTVKNGELSDYKKFENSGHTSVFTQKPDSLLKFIYKNIKWDMFLGMLENPVRVTLTITSSDNNKPEIKIMKGSGIEIYDDEAVRVTSQIPDWEFYIQRGKVFKTYYVFPILFSNKTRIKYTH